MRPINIVVLVVTVIESLRAFDLVYITNKGNPTGLELLSVLVTQNIVGETQRIGFGSALGVVLLVISLVPISIFLTRRSGGRRAPVTRRAPRTRPRRAAAAPQSAPAVRLGQRRRRRCS